jgi:hypothetical protein
MARLQRRGELSRRTLALAVLALVVCALVGTTAATADTGTSTTMPFAFGGDNPCTGETIAGTGNLHFLISSNMSASGNIQSHLQVSFSGIQANTTLPFPPKKYVVVDEEDLLDTFAPDGMPAHETVEHTLHFIRSGEDGTLFPDDDFYEHFLAHITANANGTVTVNDYTLDSSCK